MVGVLRLSLDGKAKFVLGPEQKGPVFQQKTDLLDDSLFVPEC